jgi:hypothetical protein
MSKRRRIPLGTRRLIHSTKEDFFNVNRRIAQMGKMQPAPVDKEAYIEEVGRIDKGYEAKRQEIQNDLRERRDSLTFKLDRALDEEQAKFEALLEKIRSDYDRIIGPCASYLKQVEGERDEIVAKVKADIDATVQEWVKATREAENKYAVQELKELDRQRKIAKDAEQAAWRQLTESTLKRKFEWR